MTTLARKLRTVDYFTLAFGTMVGVGWLVVMDDWLGRGGPLGAMLGFAVGGAALLPVAYSYGHLVELIPDAGSEIAYTERVFGRRAGFAAGWMMILAYWIVCPWEAVAIGRIAAYIFPKLDSIELYRVAGEPVYLPHLALGLGLVALIGAANYRGIRSSATIQNWATFGLLVLFGVFAAAGLRRGSADNLYPLFHGAALVSVLRTVQIVPYFMTGFESVPKCAEEAIPGLDAAAGIWAPYSEALPGGVLISGGSQPWSAGGGSARCGRGEGSVFIGHHLVAPPVLGAVQGLISRRQQFRPGGSVLRVGGNAHRDGN